MGFIQAPIAPTPSHLDLSGQTVIVTGANSGLGLEAARQYLLLGVSRLILAVRTVSKGEDARKYLLSDPTVKSAHAKADIKVMPLDMDSEASVAAFANQVKREIDVCDILLLNAGVALMKYETSASGHERIMQVNYHSTALLALELLPLLETTAEKRGRPSRLSFVGSAMHTSNTLKANPVKDGETVAAHWDEKDGFSVFKRYGDSKFMVAAFTQELASRVPASKVIVNNLCPGMVTTNFDKNTPLAIRTIMWAVRKLRARSVEVGARTYIYSTSVVGPESHGTFIANNTVTETDSILATAEGKVLKQKAWSEVLASAAKVDPGFNKASLE